MEFEETKLGNAAIPPMTQAQMRDAFEPIQFAASSITLPPGCYRVYRSRRDYVEVQAGSAYEAMKITNIRTPYRIERFSLGRLPVLTQELLAKNADGTVDTAALQEYAAQSDAMPPATEEVAADMPLPTEEKAASEGLEGDEVDALLNGAEE